tara:strand:- start:41279 stop:41506 length:228 start_codon:yes stop_codon:yes gene_type:complete
MFALFGMITVFLFGMVVGMAVGPVMRFVELVGSSTPHVTLTTNEENEESPAAEAQEKSRNVTQHHIGKAVTTIWN